MCLNIDFSYDSVHLYYVVTTTSSHDVTIINVLMNSLSLYARGLFVISNVLTKIKGYSADFCSHISSM